MAEPRAAVEFLEERLAEMSVQGPGGADAEAHAERAAHLERLIDGQRQVVELHESLVWPSKPSAAFRVWAISVGAFAAALAVTLSAMLLGAWGRRLGASLAATRAEEALP